MSLYLQIVASEREESRVIIVSRICRQTNRMTWEIARVFDSIMADYRHISRENYCIGVLSCAFVDVIGFPVVSFNSGSFSLLNCLKGRKRRLKALMNCSLCSLELPRVSIVTQDAWNLQQTSRGKASIRPRISSLPNQCTRIPPFGAIPYFAREYA